MPEIGQCKKMMGINVVIKKTPVLTPILKEGCSGILLQVGIGEHMVQLLLLKIKDLVVLAGLSQQLVCLKV